MPSTLPEVSITGAGAATCLGDTLAATLAALDNGHRVQGAPFPFLAGTPYAACLAAPDFAPDVSGQIKEKRMRKFMSRHAELAAAAARQALAASAPQARGIAPERMGLYAGVGLAAMNLQTSVSLLGKSLDDNGMFSQKAFTHRGLRAIHPLWSFHSLANMPACIVSVLEAIQGDNGIYTPWEDQTAFALQEAAHALYREEIDCAVVVAADTPSHPACLVTLAAAGHLAPTEIVAPGAACLVLERPTAERALPRLGDLRLEFKGTPPCDPLAALVGRTVAAAPLILAAFALFAPRLALPTRLVGCGGHAFSFEVG
jgi:3-oxoacyl-(acyl-carrier-protein) synthase